MASRLVICATTFMAARLSSAAVDVLKKVAVVGIYKNANKDIVSLESSLLHATLNLGPVAATRVVECAHPTSIDVPTNDRISVGARPGLLMAARRQYADLVETAHVTEYLGHTEALKAFLGTGSDLGLILFHPSPLTPAQSSRLSTVLSTARPPPATEKDAGGWEAGWDVLLLGYDAAPELPSPPGVMQAAAAALMGQGTAQGGGDTIGAQPAIGSGVEATGQGPVRALQAESSSLLLSPAKRWRGVYAYVVTRGGALSILKAALPMNVRYWAQLSSLAELGVVRTGWLADSSLRLSSTFPDPSVECDLCDLPPGYNRLAHIRDQLLYGGLIGYAIVAGVLYLLSKLLPGGLSPLLSRLTTACRSLLRHGPKGSEPLRGEDDEALPPPDGRVRAVLSAVLAVLRHPLTHMLLLGGVGYMAATFVVVPPWSAERFFNTGQVGALERVPLLGPQGTTWTEFATSMNSSEAELHHVVMVRTEHPNLDRLRASAAWYGDSLVVLGQGQGAGTGTGTGNAAPGSKLELVYKYVSTLPVNDLVVIGDGTRSLVMSSLTDIRESFLHMAKLSMAREREDPSGKVAARVPSILFSASKHCPASSAQCASYPPTDLQYTSFPYLSPGIIVGRAGDVARVMKTHTNYTAAGSSEAEYWTYLYLASRGDSSLPRMFLDHETDVTLCMGGYKIDKNLEFDPGIRRWKFTGTAGLPHIAHFPGKEEDVAILFDALQMKWSPYTLSQSEGLQVIVALLAILAFPVGISLGRGLDSLGLGFGAAPGYTSIGSEGGAGMGSAVTVGCCAACRRRVAVAATSVAGTGITGITAAAGGGRHEKGDE